MAQANDPVTREEMLELLAARIASVDRPHPVRVGIDGVDGAGKTSMADDLVRPLEKTRRQVIRASIDGFHNPRRMRYWSGRYSAEGYFRDSFDCESLILNLLEPLGPGGTRTYRRAVFDYRRDAPVNSAVEHCESDAILLFDGVFLHRHELDNCWDFTLFLDIGLDLLVQRLSRRDGLSPISDRELFKRYVEGQKLYLSECTPADRADVLIDHTDVERPIILRLPAR